MRFEVLMAASMEMAVFWVVVPCLVEAYRRFRGACCLHHQGDESLHGATTQKTAIFKYNSCLNVVYIDTVHKFWKNKILSAINEHNIQ
jgi:hypothetical protein